jgi:hypothetical protein
VPKDEPRRDHAASPHWGIQVAAHAAVHRSVASRMGTCGAARGGVEPSSFRQRSTFNALVTGAPGELLTANTGCPNGAPAGFSSDEWAQLGWNYGIVFTLTASEWKEGNLFANKMRAGHYKGKLHTRACHSMGIVPSVCQAEFLQGFQRGSLHSWLREMLSRNP